MSQENISKKIAVTGATGQLGKLVIDSLIARGAAEADIVAVVRDPAKAAGLKDLGVDVREGNYTKPETLVAAFEGVAKVLLISSNELGQRAVQHQNVIDAAKAAGVTLLAYTSILGAENSDLLLAVEHRETEAAILNSGIPYVFLRNGWYVENYAPAAAQAISSGTIYGSAGTGRVSVAARSDLADGAAAVLVGDFKNTAFELGGDDTVTLDELAEIISEIGNTKVVYADLSETEYAKALEAAGLPAAYAEIFANSDTGIRDGKLFTDSGDLSRLTGKASKAIKTSLETALNTLSTHKSA